MEATEFDATLGGEEHLPYSANIFKFAASRSVEIVAMTESVLRPSKSKLIFQNLPIHMRRRVMSHNCKRLPINKRQGHLEQFNKSGFAPKQKRPSRKYRRRPTNLLDEYNRRQKRHIWLETHIWHAKRFHMVDRWRHRLAYSPCDKAFRACYRATSAHCLLQDISYHTPISIQGSVDDIKKIFDSITSKACGLSITAKAYMGGNREGTLHLYKPNMYPCGYIGKVQFLWVQTASAGKDLWLFIHPSQTSTVESVLSEIISSNYTVQPMCTVAKKMKIENEQSREVNIKYNTLAGAFNRFRLTGPRAHAVLMKCLKCATDNTKVQLAEWSGYCNEVDSHLYLEEKNKYWESLTALDSPAQLPSKLVLGLVVKDPRLSRPEKRTKAQIVCDKIIDISAVLNIPTFSSLTPIWNEAVRDKIKSNRISNPEFVEHITKTQLVPGEVNEDDPNFQNIPIVLIQRPGSQNSNYKKIGYGCGWDIIAPAGYGLPFWLTFIMFGARSGGLRETENLSLEMGECYLPPDSDVGKTEEKRIEIKLKDQYFKRPPSKRVNFVKYGISSPFICPWKILLKDWCHDKVDDFFILRDKSKLNEIEDSLHGCRKLERIEKADQCLIALYVQIIGKGSLGNHALICMPQAEDINLKSFCEPLHEDTNLKLRKLKRLEHRRTLKQLKKKRMKLKRTSNKIISNGKSHVNNKQSEYVKQMRELCLPSEVNTVRFTGARETMGYISKAAYSFSEGKSCGVGYIAFNALYKLLNNGLTHILVRNISTLKYRLAKVQLIKDV